MPKVMWSDTPWGDMPADNCWRFKYLGSYFDADGDHTSDILARIAMAQNSDLEKCVISGRTTAYN